MVGDSTVVGFFPIFSRAGKGRQHYESSKDSEPDPGPIEAHGLVNSGVTAQVIMPGIVVRGTYSLSYNTGSLVLRIRSLKTSRMSQVKSS